MMPSPWSIAASLNDCTVSIERDEEHGCKVAYTIDNGRDRPVTRVYRGCCVMAFAEEVPESVGDSESFLVLRISLIPERIEHPED